MCKRVFIFGAGSSVHANGPLNKDWIERIKKNKENIKQNKIAIEFLDSLQGFDNIEALLSLVDLSIIENHNFLPFSASMDYLRNVRDKIVDCIVNVAQEINANGCLIRDFFKKTNLQEGDTVINFNYDLLVDCGLCKTGLWNPYKGIKENICGYGFGITSLNGNLEREALKDITASKINYLKLHGSINWLKYRISLELKDNTKLIDLKWDWFDPKEIFKTNIVSNKPPTDFIITPSFVKLFEDMPLRMLWRYAHKNISEASEIYIIGYSFPRADMLARQLLLHADFSLGKITVIDPLTDSSEMDKKEDIISMLPWNKDCHFWENKIETKKQEFEQFVRDK